MAAGVKECRSIEGYLVGINFKTAFLINPGVQLCEPSFVPSLKHLRKIHLVTISSFLGTC